MFSIIVRTKNEERWIAQCIRKLGDQTIQDIEVILVDNMSTDKTVLRARHEIPDIKVIEIEEYRPGMAINLGIQASKGEFIAILSAHCLPVNENWLKHLFDNFSDPRVAGVYGRQIPMRFSNSIDKRDLLVTFGLDRRVQEKDSFFHNANSMIRRDVWNKNPFDESVTNIEDRVWGEKVIEEGYLLVYEPEATVHHYHGIHQNNNKERADNVVKIMEALNGHSCYASDSPFDSTELEVAAIIPLRVDKDNKRISHKLLNLTIQSALDSKSINRVIVSTDSKELMERATKYGAETPFMRPPELSKTSVRVDEVLLHSLNELEKQAYFPDIIVSLEIVHPFRPRGLIDDLVEQLIAQGVDTIMPGFAEYRLTWWKRDNTFIRVDNFSTLKSIREPLHIGLISMGCATYPDIIRKGSRVGEKVGLVELNDPVSFLEIRDKADLDRARRHFSVF